MCAINIHYLVECFILITHMQNFSLRVNYHINIQIESQIYDFPVYYVCIPFKWFDLPGENCS